MEGVMTNKKTCLKCSEAKPVAEFNKNSRKKDGLHTQCKACRNGYLASYREKNRDKVRDSALRYAHSEKGRRNAIRSHKSRCENHPERVAAVRQVRNAIRVGHIIRQPCDVCGSHHAQAHHDDYTKVRDVRWLCYGHHREVHGFPYVAGPRDIRGRRLEEDE
jgi:uncharacterized protein (DUF983 family)